MAIVKTDKQVYLFYQDPYQANAEYMEYFKDHIKVSKAHNGYVGYHSELSASALREKHIITSETANK